MSEVVLPCPDLDEAIALFTGRLGFRLDALYPADDPRIARISRQGVVLRLERAGATSPRTGGWKRGRAGMEYLDLLPDRAGGHVIASRIRLGDGGPVADYVHYHEVDFQLIYCTAGWVRVVYEDQGPPFVLSPGDAVLQPPGIRHRVLECASGTEVVEIASPAEHLTGVDHDLLLPNETLAPDRVFDGQGFLRHQRAEAAWCPWTADGFEVCDLGVSRATGGRAAAVVARPSGASLRRSWSSSPAPSLLCAARGSVVARGERLDSDSAIWLTAGETVELSDPSPDLELLNVALSG